MKIQGQKTGNEKGVTIVALAVTIIVLLILASISIAMITGNHGLVEVANDSQIETELSQLQQTLNKYKLSGEDKRVGSGDYSGQMTNDDLISARIIKKVHIKNPEMTIGIIYLDKIGVESSLGNNAKNITEDEIENFSDLYDVFVIDLNTNDIYYVKNGEYWVREGEGNRDKSKETEGGPKISVTPNKYVGEGGTPVIISVAKGEAELASDNEYEYYLSSSSYDLQRGKWIQYTSGAAQNIGDGLTGKYYIYVKQVEDEKGKLSTGGDIVIIRGEKYHRFGEYVFEKGESEEYTITYNLNGGTVSGNPTTYTEETETFTLNNPTRLGYEFLGWTGSNGKIPDKTVTIEKGSTGNRVYEANWNINKYTVTYNYAENGGTSATRTSAIVNYGSLIDLTPTAVKEGYTFVGWNTDKNATTGMSSIKMGTSDVTLYAIYRKDITLTFVDYKGRDKIERTIEDTVYNKETSITVTAPTINSYTGWTARYWATGTGADAGQAVAGGGTISNVTGNATYYARYYQNIKVDFNLNGGTGVAPQEISGNRETNSYNVNVVVNPEITMPATNSTKTGYVFGGWNTAKDGTGTNYTVGTKYTSFIESTTLYAKWTANEYTVKYDGNGATGGSTANSTHTYDVEKELTANGYTRQYTVTYNYNESGASNTTDVAKYTFKNWNTEANGSGTSYTDKQVVKNLTNTPNDTVILYAQWNDGTVTLPTPTRTGYAFAGWYDAATGGSKIGDGGATYTPTANKTLYARWTENGYTVKYDGNGATGGSTASSSHKYDEEKELTANGYTREYTVTYNYNGSGTQNTTAKATYTFKNWNDKADGSGISYTDKQKVKNLTNKVGEVITLYAQWNSSSITLLTPTREGYTFAGWYDAATGGNKVADGGAAYTPTANKTLYAHWTANEYTVKYDGNGATGGSTANSTHTYDVEKELTANGYTKEYTVTYNYNGSGASNTTAKATYTFKNWNTAADESGTSYTDKQSVKNLSSTNGATVTLYAQWDGGTVTLPTPTREGYTFAGWYDAATGGTKVADGGAKYTPTANKTLYARWTQNGYTVKYDGNGATGGSTASSTHVYDVAKPLTANGYTKEYTVTYNYNGSGASNTTAKATYTFKNWNTAANGSGTTYTDKQSVKNLTSTPNGTVTLYAQWNSGSVTLPTPTREGYTFAGWYDKATGGTKVADGGAKYTPTANTTLYAYWNINAYTVTYNYSENGGTSATKTTATVNYGAAIDLTPTATKSGYVFVGWNTDENATTKLSSLTMKTSNVTLYAIYSKTVTATFNYYNKQSKTVSGTMYNKATTTDIKAPDITDTVSVNSVTYSMRGWATKDAGNANIDLANDGTKALSSNATYYASYSATITATLKTYNGTSSGATATKTGTAYLNYAGTVTNASINLGTTSLSGYTFRGWSTSDAADATIGVAANGTASININTTYYASYTYTVTATLYVYNNSSSEKTGTAYLNYKGDVTNASINLGTTSLSGYTFRGWSTDKEANAGITVAANGTASINENKTYYASYTYTVTLSYNVNGGSGTFSSQNGTAYMNYTGSKVSAKLTVSSKKPTRTGYTFSTWNTNSAGTETSYSPSGSIELVTNVTLYAIWKDTTPPTVDFSINGGSFAKPTFGNATVKTEVIANDDESGLKTTQYIWSTSTTQPTSGWITFTNGTFISKNDCIVGNYYLWIKAIDNENNTYITHSNAFSIINATITITPNTTSWTNKDITGTVAYSNSILINRKAGYGTTLEEAQKNISTNTSTKIIAPENGYFYAEATDSMGNKVYENLQITNIDKITPAKPEIKEIGGASDILIQFTPKDNESGSGIGKVATDTGETLTPSNGQYSLKIGTNGTSTITIYDKAGNSVSFKYTIQFFAKKYNQCTSFTGGWSQNYFRNAYGNIPGITYKYENGVFAIYALPQSGYGRVGTWYTNNAIDLSDWQYIHTVSSLDIETTGTWNLWLDGAKVLSKTYADGEYNDGRARWIRLDYEIKPEDKSKHIIIGSDGLDNQTIRGYFALGFLSKIE